MCGSPKCRVFCQTGRPAIENCFALFSSPIQTLLDIVPPKAVAEEEEAFGASTQQDSEQFEWRLYTVNE